MTFFLSRMIHSQVSFARFEIFSGDEVSIAETFRIWNGWLKMQRRIFEFINEAFFFIHHIHHIPSSEDINEVQTFKKLTFWSLCSNRRRSLGSCLNSPILTMLQQPEQSPLAIYNRNRIRTISSQQKTVTSTLWTLPSLFLKS